MQRSSSELPALLDRLGRQARAAGLTDTQWAARAGVRKETLSRLRRRATCDFATLTALAAAVDSRLGLLDTEKATTADGHCPAGISREYEQQLLDLSASRSLNMARWAALGPRFFMAGLAVMLASVSGYNRRGLLALAEQLHPGISEAAVFARWLERSPLRPSRFLPLLSVATRHAEKKSAPKRRK